MSIKFNTILESVGITVKDVRLLRHKDSRAQKGKTPFELWRDQRDKFELYQSTQSIQNRKKFTAPYWAVFVVTPANENMFVGLYSATYKGLLENDTPKPHTEGIDLAGSCDVFQLTLHENLNEYIGRLFIEWGSGALAWVQYAHRNDKTIVEIRKKYAEPEFPGFLRFIEPLSKLESLPQSWISILSSVNGVYLLTCPKTKELYVGSTHGESGFWGRWMNYVKTGHGGNVALMNRELSDYQVSILEVAGSAASIDDIFKMEGLWQQKLKTNEMGLNRNIAWKVIK